MKQHYCPSLPVCCYSSVLSFPFPCFCPSLAAHLNPRLSEAESGVFPILQDTESEPLWCQSGPLYTSFVLYSFKWLTWSWLVPYDWLNRPPCRSRRPHAAHTSVVLLGRVWTSIPMCFPSCRRVLQEESTFLIKTREDGEYISILSFSVHSSEVICYQDTFNLMSSFTLTKWQLP